LLYQEDGEDLEFILFLKAKDQKGRNFALFFILSINAIDFSVDFLRQPKLS